MLARFAEVFFVSVTEFLALLTLVIDRKMSFFGSYFPCPFDNSHRILCTRIQKHIVKCRKNYPKDIKLQCYFDATHVLNPEEFEHHLSICSSSGNIRCFKQSLEPEQKLGTKSLEETCKVQTDTICDEDWSGGNATYNPITASESKNVMRSVVGLSKAKKIQFKQYERERIAMIEKKHNNTIDNKSFTQKEPVFETPLRKPKNAAKATSLNQTSDNKDKDVSFEHLLTKLREVDLEKDNTLLEKNVSIKNNSSSGENSKENSANNISNENSSLRNGQESISKKKLNMTRNDVKNNEKPKETDTKNNSIHQHLNKERNKHINSRLATNVEVARKISTGRGFTIAYQKIKSEISKEQGESASLDHYNSVFGYDEDKNDNNDVTSQAN